MKGRNLWPKDGLATNLCESLDPCFSSTPSLGALHPQILNEFLGGSRASTHQSPVSFSGSLRGDPKCKAIFSPFW